MPVPNDAKRSLLTDKVLPLNWRIALAKGWTWYEEWVLAPIIYENAFEARARPWTLRAGTHWRNPEGEPAIHPRYVNALECVAGLLRELGDEWNWNWDGSRWRCYRDLNPMYPNEIFWSLPHHSGDCVGEAWLSVFEKETVGA